MKAEHRKELQTNILADTIGHLLRSSKEGMSRGVLLILGLVALAVVVYLGWLYFSRVGVENRSAMWLKVDQGDRKLDTAADVGQLQEVLKDLELTAGEKPDAVPSRVMRFACARTQLRLGLGGLCSKEERDRAKQRVQQAGDLYAGLADVSQDTPILHQEALLGAAQAQESLGQVQEALEGYHKLDQLYPNSVAGQEARTRIKKLESSEKHVADFYAAMNNLVSSSPKPR